MRFTPHATKRSLAQLRRCCLHSGWECWGRCSTGPPPPRWPGGAWRPCLWTAIEIGRNESGRANSCAGFLVASFRHDACAGLLLGLSQLRLVVLELLGAVDHLVAGIGRVVPALDLHPLAFKILVDGKEVGDLLEHVG